MAQVYFNQTEFAERISRSTRWLRKMAQVGAITPRRVGGALFYSDDMLGTKPEPSSPGDDFDSQVERGLRILREVEAHG